MLKVIIDLDAVRHNYRVLQSACKAEVMPVVKADAYGHGMVMVSRVLAGEGVRSFAVGTVDEGLDLRKICGAIQVYSLFGPIETEDYKKIQGSGVIPFIHSWSQIRKMAKSPASSRGIELGLKFDTGMSRLGFKPDDAAGLSVFLQQNSSLKLQIISSHLAHADKPGMEHKAAMQMNIFRDICRVFDEAGFRYKKSLANSAGILNCNNAWFDMVRPGISLYGGNPFTGTFWEEKGTCLKQAMQVTAPVLSVHTLPKGQGISYGHTFTAPRDMKVAIIACGYADNYPRCLSNLAWMLFQGRRLPVIGRVCMQLTAVDASHAPDLAEGDRVFILGGDGKGDIDVHELAAWWQTISYEVFCQLGKNHRTYVNGSFVATKKRLSA